MQTQTTMRSLQIYRNGFYGKKKQTRNKYWQGCGEEGTPVHCCGECKFVQHRDSPRKAQIELANHAAVPPLGIYPKKMKTLT